MAKYLEKWDALQFMTAGKQGRFYMHSSTLQPAFDSRSTSAEQEDTGSEGRSKAICSTASCKDAFHNLSSLPLGLLQRQ